MTDWTPNQLKEHYDALSAAERRTIKAERRATQEMVKRLDQATLAAEKAAAVALASADKIGEKHNELIRKGENKEAEFASKGEVGLIQDALGAVKTAQARVAGASIVGATVLAILINLILRLAGVGTT
jgi:hypothetical protein